MNEQNLKIKILLGLSIDLIIDLIFYFMTYAMLSLNYELLFLRKYTYLHLVLFFVFFLTLSLLSIGLTKTTLGFFLQNLKFLGHREINFVNYWNFSVGEIDCEPIEVTTDQIKKLRLNGKSQGVTIAGEAIFLLGVSYLFKSFLVYYFPSFYENDFPHNFEIVVMLFLFHIAFPLRWRAGPYSALTRSFVVRPNGKLDSWWKFLTRVILMIFTLGFAPYIPIKRERGIFLDDWLTKSSFVHIPLKD